MPVTVYQLPGVDVGELPEWLDERDPRPAREQFDAAYQHGGGWSPFKGHTFNTETQTLDYPGDPPMRPLAAMRLRDELIVVFECDWVMIRQKDGSYEVCRMD
jgi:hypothetical protein